MFFLSFPQSFGRESRDRLKALDSRLLTSGMTMLNFAVYADHILL